MLHTVNFLPVAVSLGECKYLDLNVVILWGTSCISKVSSLLLLVGQAIGGGGFMKRLLQAVLAMAMCLALAPFVSADEHGRDHDRDEHHDRGHHYAYGHDRHHGWDRDRDRDWDHDRGHHYAYGHDRHRDWDRDRDRDWDHDRRTGWSGHPQYRHPATTQVVNNRAPVGPNGGTPARHHIALPQVAGQGARGQQSKSSGVFGANRR